MKLLLDTHIWIWSLVEWNRLSRRVQHELKNQDNELWLSPVSTWEVLFWHAKGRIQLEGQCAGVGFECNYAFSRSSLTHEIVAAAQELPLSHQDPADRFLAATAGVLGLTPVTADHRLLGLGTIATLANR